MSKKKRNKYVPTGFWYSVGRNILWHFAAFILFVICLFCFRFKIEGKKKLKALKKQGYIITVNHCHIFDSIITMFAIYPKKLRIVTLVSNLKIPVAGAIISLAGGVGLPGDYAGLKTMTKELAEVIHKGEIVLLMPEAHLIHHCPVLREFKKGAFFIAKNAHAKVVPVAYRYRLTRFKSIRYTLCVGDPIDTAELTVEQVNNKAFEVMQGFTKGNAEVFYKSKFYQKLKKKNKLAEYEQFQNPFEKDEEKEGEAGVGNSGLYTVKSEVLREVACTAAQEEA